MLEQVFERIAFVKDYRSAMVERVRGGELTLGEVFVASSRDAVLASTKILPFVEAVPDVGKVRSRRALAAIGIDDSALIESVTDDLRIRLLDALEEM